MGENVSSISDIDLNAEGSYKYEVTNPLENSNALKTPFGPLHYMVAAAGVSLVLFLIYVVYQQARDSQNQEQRPSPEENSCEHRSCARIQLSNPSCSCLLDTLSRNRAVTTNENVRVVNYSSAYSLDLPPSYLNSVRHDNPPSYEEAINQHI